MFNLAFAILTLIPKALVLDQEDVYFASFRADGRLMIAGGTDKNGFVKLWDLAKNEMTKGSSDFPSGVWEIVGSPQEKTCACVTATSIYLLDLETWQSKRNLITLFRSLLEVQLAPDARTVGFRLDYERIVLWDLQKKVKVATINVGDWILSFALTSDGKEVLVATCRQKDFKVSFELYDLQATKLKTTQVTTDSDFPRGSAWSPGNKLFAVAYPAEYSAELQKLIAKMKETPPPPIWSFFQEFHAAMAKLDEVKSKAAHIKVWETASGKEVALLKKHNQRIEALTFSPSGKLLASGSNDGNIKVWHLAQGKTVAEFWAPTEIRSLAFSPDETRLAAVSWDRRVRIWDVKHHK